MPLINFEINLILNWLENCANSEGNRVTTFAITDTKLYVPVGSLLTNDNANLLQYEDLNEQLIVININQK